MLHVLHKTISYWNLEQIERPLIIIKFVGLYSSFAASQALCPKNLTFRTTSHYPTKHAQQPRNTACHHIIFASTSQKRLHKLSPYWTPVNELHVSTINV
jgi:hypothetical protein